MTTDEALSRVTEVDCDGKPLYPAGSVVKTLAMEVICLRAELDGLISKLQAAGLPVARCQTGEVSVDLSRSSLSQAAERREEEGA